MATTLRRPPFFALIAVLLTCAFVQSQEKPDPRKLQEAAIRAFEKRDYAAAEKALRALTVAQPEEGEAWYRLGYVLHQQGKLKEARSAHLKAVTKFERRAPLAAYNIACVDAREGRKDQAIEWLQKAAKLGFIDWRHAQRDSDLEGLRGDPRLAAVIADMKASEATSIRTVAIFVHDGVELLDFAGPGEVFAAARGKGNKRFRVVTVAAQKTAITSQGFLKVVPQHSFADCPQPDVLVLPGGATRRALQDKGLVPWVRRVAKKTEVVMSVCTGALILAEAGLLDGLEATTHFSALDALRAKAPKTVVRSDRRIVDNGAIVTTAGVSAGIDGALHVVARLLGDEAATRCARYMEYRWTREHDRATPSGKKERVVEFRHGKDDPTFAGTLVLPARAGPHPAVVLVSPAGEHPRDELRSGGEHYKHLAAALAERGVAPLRVDNRGIGGSRNQAWPKWDWSVTMQTLARDIAGHCAWLRDRSDIDARRVGVLAHGDGTVPAARLAAGMVKGARQPAFTLLLSASGQRGVDDLARRMLARIPAKKKLGATAQKQLRDALAAMVESGPTEAVVDQLAACLTSFGFPRGQARPQAKAFAKNYGHPWHREYLGQEPRELLGRIKGKLLVLMADDDDHIDAAASERVLADTFGSGTSHNAKWRRLAKGGHFLEPDDGRKVLRDEVVELVARFIAEATARPSR